MKSEQELAARLARLDRPRGREVRDLWIGENTIRFEGLDLDLARELEGRWGGYLTAPGSRRPDYTVRVHDAGGQGWLARWTGAENYRVEAIDRGATQVVVSYHFALGPEGPDGIWRLGITETADEPLGRILDNSARLITARLALDLGGFAIHGAGVLHKGRAYVFAGPSNAGKSTAVRSCTEISGLGDDFAVVVRGERGWCAAGVPFDNSERAPSDPPRGWFPVAGIWRLHQAAQNRVARLGGTVDVASLIACAAFPWTAPDLAQPLLDHVRGYVADGGFAHLYFTIEGGFWTDLVSGSELTSREERGT